MKDGSGNICRRNDKRKPYPRGNIYNETQRMARIALCKKPKEKHFQQKEQQRQRPYGGKELQTFEKIEGGQSSQITGENLRATCSSQPELFRKLSHILFLLLVNDHLEFYSVLGILLSHWWQQKCISPPHTPHPPRPLP